MWDLQSHPKDFSTGRDIYYILLFVSYSQLHSATAIWPAGCKGWLPCSRTRLRVSTWGYTKNCIWNHALHSTNVKFSYVVYHFYAFSFVFLSISIKSESFYSHEFRFPSHLPPAKEHFTQERPSTSASSSLHPQFHPSLLLWTSRVFLRLIDRSAVPREQDEILVGESPC